MSFDNYGKTLNLNLGNSKAFFSLTNFYLLCILGMMRYICPQLAELCLHEGKTSQAHNQLVNYCQIRSSL